MLWRVLSLPLTSLLIPLTNTADHASHHGSLCVLSTECKHAVWATLNTAGPWWCRPACLKTVWVLVPSTSLIASYKKQLSAEKAPSLRCGCSAILSPFGPKSPSIQEPPWACLPFWSTTSLLLDTCDGFLCVCPCFCVPQRNQLDLLEHAILCLKTHDQFLSVQNQI